MSKLASLDDILIPCSDTEAVAFGGLGASVDIKLLSQVLYLPILISLMKYL